MIRRWRELLLAVGSIMLALLASEIALRVYLWQRARAELRRVERQATVTRVDTCQLGDIIRIRAERDLFYELKPNLRGRYCGGNMSTNALGMRMSSEPELEKPARTLRLVAVGDSYLFGQGVDDGQGFLEVLQRRPLADGRRLQALNFGVPGYNSWMEAAVLTTRAAKYAPDIILVSVMGNDWDLPSFMLSRPYTSAGHSFLLSMLAERLRDRPEVPQTPRSRPLHQGWFGMPEEVPEAFHQMVGFEAYRRALASMLRTAESVQAPLVLFSDCLATPATGGSACSFPFDPGQYELVQKEVYGHHRVTLCAWQLPQDLLIPRDGHPTKDGHVSLSEQLQSCLGDNGILPQ